MAEFRKASIVSTPQRTDGMRWMIRFGWVTDRAADEHLHRMDAIGAKCGKMVNSDSGSACPLVWTEDLPRAVYIATKFPLHVHG